MEKMLEKILIMCVKGRILFAISIILFFHLHISASEDCGGQLTGVSGTFTSPNYPRNYDDNMRCTWTIDVDGADFIQLSFSDFRLENEANCQYDNVTIYNSDNTLIGRYCGTSLPSVMQSTSNTMKINFYSDYNQIFQGFEAFYIAVKYIEMCSAHLTTEIPLLSLYYNEGDSVDAELCECKIGAQKEHDVFELRPISEFSYNYAMGQFVELSVNVTSENGSPVSMTVKVRCARQISIMCGVFGAVEQSLSTTELIVSTAETQSSTPASQSSTPANEAGKLKDKESDNNAFSLATVLGAAFGGLVIGLVLGLLLFILCKCRNQNDPRKRDIDELNIKSDQKTPSGNEPIGYEETMETENKPVITTPANDASEYDLEQPTIAQTYAYATLEKSGPLKCSATNKPLVAPKTSDLNVTKNSTESTDASQVYSLQEEMKDEKADTNGARDPSVVDDSEASYYNIAQTHNIPIFLQDELTKSGNKAAEPRESQNGGYYNVKQAPGEKPKGNGIDQQGITADNVCLDLTYTDMVDNEVYEES